MPDVTPVLSRLTGLLSRIALILLPLWAALTLLAYALTPLLGEARDALAAQLSAYLGVDVQIGELQARWYPGGPVLQLYDVVLAPGTAAATPPPDDRPLQLREIRVRPDLVAWWRHRERLPLRLELFGARLHLIREANGAIRVTPAALFGGQGGRPPARLVLTDTTLIWEDRRHRYPAREIGPLAAILHPADGGLRIDAGVSAREGRLRAAIQLHGDPASAAWRLEAQLRFQRLLPTLLLSSADAAPWPGLRLSGDLQLTLDARDTLSGSGWVQATAGRHSAQAPVGHGVRELRSGLRFQLDRAGGRLALRDLSLRRDGHRWPDSDWQLAWQTGRELQLQAGFVRLPDLLALLPALPAVTGPGRPLGADGPAAAAWQAVQSLALQGDLHDLRLMLSRPVADPASGPATGPATAAATGTGPAPAAPATVASSDPPALATSASPDNAGPGGSHGWQLRYAAQIRGLGGRVPPADHKLAGARLDGLDGTLRGDLQGAQLRLHSKQVQLTAPRVFAAPLPPLALHGTLDWRRDPADGTGWQLQAPSLRLSSAVLQTHTRLALRAGAGTPLWVDLQTDFGPFDVDHLPDYLPIGVMAPPLQRWMAHGLPAGRVTGGTALLHGPLADFPFPQHSGRFEVLVGVEDAIVDYRPGWPRVEEATAELHFVNNRLDFVAESGRLLDSTARGVRGSIPQLDPTQPLRLQGTVNGPAGDLLRLLRESPLQRRYADAVAAMALRGDSQLALDLTIPLVRRGDYALDGEITLRDGELDLRGPDLTLDALRGTLRLDLEGITAERLAAELDGRPLQLALARPADGGLQINAELRADRELLLTRYPALAALRPSGSTALQIGLHLPRLESLPPPNDPAAASPAAPPVIVTSDLRGLALDLPAPLGKRAAEVAPLRLEIPVRDDGTPYRVRYRDRLHLLSDGQLQRLALGLGERPAQLPERPGWQARGSLPQLDLDAWLALRDAGTASVGDNTALPPLDLDLRIDQLRAGGLDWPQQHIRLQRDGRGALQVRLQGAHLDGQLDWPAADATVTVALERLTLPGRDPAAAEPAAAPTAATGEPPAATPPSLSPQTLPAMDISVRSLRLGELELGQLSAQTRPHRRGLHLQRLTLQGPQGELQAEGIWSQGATAQATRLRASLRSAHTAEVLRALGYNPALADAEVQAELALRWPGHPGAATLQDLDGSLTLAVDKGRFVSLEPGVTRVLGLLNFSGLLRRLELDFTDLFRQGYSFDGINGGFQLANGQATTDDLTIRSASGELRVRGSTDLLAGGVDQEITYVPNLDAALTLLGGLTGGPVGAAAGFVVDKLFDRQVETLSRFQYQLRGPWDEPEIRITERSGPVAALLDLLRGGQPARGSADAPAAADDDPHAIYGIDE